MEPPSSQRARRPDGKSKRTIVPIPFTTSLKDQTSLCHPAGCPRAPFPAAAASPVAQGFQALALEGGRRDHTMSGCASAEPAGHEGPPRCPQPGPVFIPGHLCSLQAPTWLWGVSHHEISQKCLNALEHCCGGKAEENQSSHHFVWNYSLFQLPHHTGLHVDNNSSCPRPEAAVSPSLPCSLTPQSTVFAGSGCNSDTTKRITALYIFIYHFNNT